MSVTDAAGGDGLRRSPLHRIHVEAGAVLTPFAGWQLPLRYTSETAEHRAVRSAAGLFDLSHMGQFRVHGPAATEVLDRAVVSDIAAVRPGRARYTVMCDDSGGVVDDLIVYRLGVDELVVIANAVNAGPVLGGLHVAAEGLAATVSTIPDALIAVQGPRAAQIVAAVSGDPASLSSVRPYGCVRGDVAGVPALVARTGYTGEDGYEIAVPADQAPEVWRAISASGTAHGLVPTGLACRDSLRLEAGMALYGHELSLTTDPFQAGLGRVVAFGKAQAFAGRAALESAAHRPPRRVLSGLVATGRRILRQGQLMAPADATAPDQVGEVTSGGWSPTLERSIAMAYLPPALAVTGTRLLADVRGATVEAVVTDLPFYRRPSGPPTPGPRSHHMSDIPDGLDYTPEHEWLARGTDATAGSIATVGITAVATEQLGDLVFLDLPQVGAAVTAGSVCGEVESTKSVNELYSPVTGAVTEVNEAAVADPAVVNADPYGQGWLFRVDVVEVGPVMSASEYRSLTEGD